MDWDRVRIFYAAAEAGSLTRAGEVLGLSQSAVSRQVSALEAELDVHQTERERDIGLLRAIDEPDSATASDHPSPMGSYRELVDSLEHRWTALDRLVDDGRMSPLRGRRSRRASSDLQQASARKPPLPLAARATLPWPDDLPTRPWTSDGSTASRA